jgi:hypothetical protein
MKAGQPLRALIQVSWTKHDRNVQDGSGAVAPTSKEQMRDSQAHYAGQTGTTKHVRDGSFPRKQLSRPA